MNLSNSQVLLLQRAIRRFLKKKNSIVSSEKQTKEWRKNEPWYKNGKSNECEKYQIKLLETILKEKLSITNHRIHFNNLKLVSLKNIFNQEDFFEYSETLDRVLIKNDKTFYFNLKFICDDGGTQTRSLRETYHFIKNQFAYIIKNKTSSIYFINILDGSTCHKYLQKLTYLTKNHEYKKVNKFIFIGDSFTFYSLLRRKLIIP